MRLLAPGPGRLGDDVRLVASHATRDAAEQRRPVEDPRLDVLDADIEALEQGVEVPYLWLLARLAAERESHQCY